MNRRSFLAMLGVAPVVLPALPETKQVPLEGEIIPPGKFSPRETVQAGVLRARDGGTVIDFAEGSIRFTDQYPVDLEHLARDVREFNEWVFEQTKPGSPYYEALEALDT
jgi:hypothetical protein